jgi:hypothetical protein
MRDSFSLSELNARKKKILGKHVDHLPGGVIL